MSTPASTAQPQTFVRPAPEAAAGSPGASAVPAVTGVAADQLRSAMGLFATGVTVVTTRDAAGRPYGTTANAVSSVSLRPPLVLACLREESETLAALLESRRFAINVLHRSQSALSDRFARRAASDTWDAVAHRSLRGIPLLGGTIATLQCDLHDIADGGDHVVVVGHVIQLEHAAASDAEPLLFYGGGYRQIGSPPPVADQIVEPTEVALPSRQGPLRMISLSEDEAQTSVAVITGNPRGRRRVLVYPHTPCVFGDALGSTACTGGARLRAAQERMRADGHGVIVYHRDPLAELAHCGCGDGTESPPRLSDAAIAALTRTASLLDLRAVRILCSREDGRRAARAGVPIDDLLEFDRRDQ